MARKKRTTRSTRLKLPADYGEFLDSLKQRVHSAQTKAMLSVNRELIALYWDIGRKIVERQEREGWGRSIVDRLAADIQKAFPGIKGFSPRNVWRMRTFYLAYAKEVTNLPQAVTEMGGENLPQPVAEIPWGHNVWILEKVKQPAQRLWYAAKTLEHGWSRAVLTAQIESDLYGRQGKAISNFADTLPPPQSDLAQQSLKDPYLFDFLTLHDDAIERDLEGGLVDHIQRFLIELGAGFAFVGRQFHLGVGEDDIAKPIGVAEWQTRLVHSLPDSLKGSLPTIEEIEHELTSVENLPTEQSMVVQKRGTTKWQT